MDQGQMPAQPTTAISPADLLDMVGKAEPIQDGTDKENRANAARELEMITELLGSRAFEWFESEFIDKPYETSFAALRRTHTRPDDLPIEQVQRTYVALREIKVGIIEREISHRELISPSDPRIAVLRAKLKTM